jgi:UDP-N-acetyl-D-mannosaminuronic acid transferase (WecB/TagA/CpsF family)
MLGIDFFMGTPAEAIAYLSKHGGMVIAPAAPSFIALEDDPDWGSAIADADLAIADSGWAVLFWRLIQRERLTRISGLALFKALLETADARIPGNLFFVLPSEKAKTKTLEFARSSGYPTTPDNCYVAPRYQRAKDTEQRSDVRVQKAESRGQRSDLVGQALPPAEPIDAGKRERPPYNSDLQSSISHLPSTAGPPLMDPHLVSILEQRQPKHIIIGIGGGMQDKLGSYLKHQLSYRPAIYCIGAAPGFVTGDQVVIPMWADRFFIGWIFRLFTQPRTLWPRLWSARRLPGMIWRYGREVPGPD